MFEITSISQKNCKYNTSNSSFIPELFENKLLNAPPLLNTLVCLSCNKDILIYNYQKQDITVNIYIMLPSNSDSTQILLFVSVMFFRAKRSNQNHVFHLVVMSLYSRWVSYSSVGFLRFFWRFQSSYFVEYLSMWVCPD